MDQFIRQIINERIPLNITFYMPLGNRKNKTKTMFLVILFS